MSMKVEKEVTTRDFVCTKCGHSGRAGQLGGPGIWYEPGDPRQGRPESAEHFRVRCSACGFEWSEPIDPKVFRVIEVDAVEDASRVHVGRSPW